jgi:4-hydroxy-tetrahydrodipicolinate reductase
MIKKNKEGEKMNVVIAGSGKLAKNILESKDLQLQYTLQPWDNFDRSQNAVIIHVGSGRQLDDITEYCSSNQSLLIQLSTGLEIKKYDKTFPVIICPNISILVVKFMYMLEKFGKYFQDYEIQLVESHQSQKRSVPGTALHFADSLKVDHEKIITIRDKNKQQEELNIPDAFIDSHAYHEIKIKDNNAELILKTKVYGHDGYSKGVEKLLKAISEKTFENKIYNIIDLIDMGYL